MRVYTGGAWWSDSCRIHRRVKTKQTPKRVEGLSLSVQTAAAEEEKTPGGDPLRWEESARVSRGGNVGKRNRLNLPAYLFIIYIYFFFFLLFFLLVWSVIDASLSALLRRKFFFGRRIPKALRARLISLDISSWLRIWNVALCLYTFI